jgi:hypothetical protein
MSEVRPEVTGRRAGISSAGAGVGHYRGPPLPSLSALELERHISVREAAALKGVSEDTFLRHYKHLVRKVSPRRSTVKLRDLLMSEESVV